MKFRTVLFILLATAGVAVLSLSGVRWLHGGRTTSPRVSTSSICDIASVHTALAAPYTATLRRLNLREAATQTEDLRSYDQGPTILVAPDTLRQIQRLFERRVSHVENEVVAKPCLPEYQLLLTLPSSPRDVQLALCFDCEIVGIYEADSQISRDDFDTIASELASLIKPLFPGDSEIQRLR